MKISNFIKVLLLTGTTFVFFIGILHFFIPIPVFRIEEFALLTEENGDFLKSGITNVMNKINMSIL